ncbi:MAG: hypothetical protein PHQ96_00795 [Candidatus Omnitrophica bacterium]|nr:hypothetical protein [Candidatus Omnitrophota bacterium]
MQPSNTHKVEKLLYNRTAKTLVTQVRLESSRLYISRIYSRHIKEKQYRMIGYSFRPDCSYESVITSTKSPKIYFNVQKRIQKDATTVAENWLELRSFNLTTKDSETIINESDFMLSKNEKRAWVYGLLGVADGDKGLICSIAFERKGSGKGYIDYYLCELILKTRKIKKLTLLKEFFLVR